jgi:DNA repair exonuclease SbcCD ATPase subunit
MWSRLSSELEGRRRAAELATLDDFFKPAIAKRAVMAHHMEDTVDSARAIIHQILKNHPIALDIQKEIVDEHKNINQTSAGVAVDEKLTQLAHEYELKLKEQFEAAEQARRERDEETRKEQLEEAQKVQQLLRNLEEEKRNQARQYQLLQDQFAEAERKREQAMREAEERSRREAKAAEARWRQDLEAAERRRAQEKADLEERMRNMAIAPPSYSASVTPICNADHDEVEVNYRTIVSGGTYTLYNKRYELYATLDRDEKYGRHLFLSCCGSTSDERGCSYHEKGW